MSLKWLRPKTLPKPLVVVAAEAVAAEAVAAEAAVAIIIINRTL